MTHGDDTLLQDLRDEADLCANEGVVELSALLNAAADRLGYFLHRDAISQKRHISYVCPVCAASMLEDDTALLRQALVALKQVAVLAEYGTTGPGKCASDALTAQQATSLRLAISDIARAAITALRGQLGEKHDEVPPVQCMVFSKGNKT